MVHLVHPLLDIEVLVRGDLDGGEPSKLPKAGGAQAFNFKVIKLKDTEKHSGHPSVTDDNGQVKHVT